MSRIDTVAPSLPLAVYIHWPFCKSKCPYCDFNSHVRESVDQQQWKTALLCELDHMASHAKGRKVTSIFFGGGTPSLMPAATAQALIERVGTLFSLADDIEITLEANPTSVEANTFADFRRAGINRVSLGVQSLSDDALNFLGREHSAKEALRAVEKACNVFDRYTFDLIYARPGQTVSLWEDELTEALGYIGGHMSLYQLTIEENTAFHHAYTKGGFSLPDEETSEELYRLTEDLLAAKGLQAYEVSNYAKHGEESRHNLSYWKGDDYIGVGPGAHGRIAAPHRIATQTIKSPERWLEAVSRAGHGVEVWQEISQTQEAEERLMMGLRLREGINYASFKVRSGFDLRDYLDAMKIEFYTQQGLLVDSKDTLQTTLSGRLLLNRLTTELLS